MKYKLYKAGNRVSCRTSYFLVRGDGMVAMTSSENMYKRPYNELRKIELSKRCADIYMYQPSRIFNDAVNPTLIAEWED